MLFRISCIALLPLISQQAGAAADRYRDGIRQFVRATLKDPKIDHMVIATVPRHAGQPLIRLVYIKDRDWCGSGGCTLLIIRENRIGRPTVIGKTGAVRTPVRYSGRTINGYPVIEFLVQGGGVVNGYQGLLKFDGRRYRSYPSIRVITKLGGETLIAD